jgi:hypothetical protein
MSYEVGQGVYIRTGWRGQSFIEGRVISITKTGMVKVSWNGERATDLFVNTGDIWEIRGYEGNDYRPDIDPTPFETRKAILESAYKLDKAYKHLHDWTHPNRTQHEPDLRAAIAEALKILDKWKE